MRCVIRIQAKSMRIPSYVFSKVHSKERERILRRKKSINENNIHPITPPKRYIFARAQPPETLIIEYISPTIIAASNVSRNVTIKNSIKIFGISNNILI